MSKRVRERDLGTDRGKRAALRIWGVYLLVLSAWVVAVAVLGLFGMVVCSSIHWQPGPLYWLLKVAQEYFLLVAIVCVLAGWVVISYFFIARSARNQALLLAGAEALAHPTDAPIRLPEGLKAAEDQLNLVREQALANARAAREAEQRKNDLVVYLAHDLKTPLTSVIGYLTLLRDEPQISPELRARYTGVALEKAERLEELVNEFFDITRFSLSHLELEVRDTDLKRMLEQMCSEFAPVLAEHQLGCRLSLPEGLHAVCDADKMARVFDNLLSNACHYAYPGTDLEAEGRMEGDRVVLTFRNAGAHIPPEKLARMFERFFRLDPSRGTRTGNAGLGLAIAKEIVESHGGNIRCESNGRLTSFVISLPLYKEVRHVFKRNRAGLSEPK